MGLIHEIADPEKLIEAAKAMIKNRAEAGGSRGTRRASRLPGGPVYSPAGISNLWPPAIAILRK
jgi:3-hydroxyacyl-CoA dehydrogenase/enoyl-CoA hydratase/3-hydroxybutyryl-CoA epimerase